MILILLFQAANAQGGCLPQDIPSLTLQARTQLLDEDAAGALRTIRQAEQSIPCANSHLWPHHISMLYQTYAAANAANSGQTASRAQYEDATRMVPSVPFDPNLYPDGRELFYDALDRTRASERISVTTARGAILDGDLIPPGGSREVPPGKHIVQYLSDNGELITEVETLGADRAIGLPAVPSSPPPVHRPSPVALSGVGLLVAGGALLTSGAYWQRRAGEYTAAGLDEAAAINRTANILTFTGIGAVSVGTGAMVSGFFASGSAGVALTVHR